MESSDIISAVSFYVKIMFYVQFLMNNCARMVFTDSIVLTHPIYTTLSKRWHQHKMCLFLSSPQAVIVKLSGYKSDLFNINLGVHSLLAGRRVLVATSPTNTKEGGTTTQGRDSMRQNYYGTS